MEVEYQDGVAVIDINTHHLSTYVLYGASESRECKFTRPFMHHSTLSAALIWVSECECIRGIPW